MAHPALHLHDISLPEPTGPMPLVPPEIFRRRMTARLLEDAEESIQKLEQALLADNAGAASASRYHLAAVIAGILHDDDLQQHFLKRRNEAIQQARNIQPMRHREKRKPPLDGK